MTENKRFILVDIGFVRDNGKLIGMKDIVEVMNALHEENQALKLRLEFIEAHNKALIHTNDELKKDLRKYDKLLELEYWREK